MPRIDHAAVAVNAAGIADAMWCLRSEGTVVDSRFDALVEQCDGWVGALAQVAEAGKLMERFRAMHGARATWGGELPAIYEVWDAVAQALWKRLGTEPLDTIVRRAIDEVMSVQSA